MISIFLRDHDVNPNIKLVKNTLIILVAFGFPLFFVRGSSRFTGQTSSLSKNIYHCFDQDNYTILTSLMLGFTYSVPTTEQNQEMVCAQVRHVFQVEPSFVPRAGEQQVDLAALTNGEVPPLVGQMAYQCDSDGKVLRTI